MFLELPNHFVELGLPTLRPVIADRDAVVDLDAEFLCDIVPGDLFLVVEVAVGVEVICLHG